MSITPIRGAGRLAAVVALTAAVLPAAVAGALPPPGNDPVPHPPRPPVTSPPATSPPLAPPPLSVTVPPVESLARRRYVIQGLGFHAVDESGPDWPGSDEVFAVWESDTNIAVTNVFNDVDSGDSRTFGVTERCIIPIGPLGADDGDGRFSAENGDQWRCLAQGAPAPMTIRVSLYEDVSPLQFWEWNCFRASDGLPPSSCPDDLIGRQSLTFSAEELAAALPAVGSTYEETITLGDYCDGAPVCTFTGPVYTLTYRITRFADRPPILGQ